MKKIFILLLTTLTISTLFSSCKKEKAEVIENAVYINNEKVLNLNYAAMELSNNEDGYTFQLSKNDGTRDYPNSEEDFFIQIPAELLGTKINLNNYENKYNWYPLININSITGNLDFSWDPIDYDDFNGENNNIKIIKNGDDNYTVEVNLNYEGKQVKIYYSGKFGELAVS